MKTYRTWIQLAVSLMAFVAADFVGLPARADDYLTPIQLPNAIPLKTIATVHRIRDAGKGWKVFGCYPEFTLVTPLTTVAQNRLRRDCLKDLASSTSDLKASVAAGVDGALEYQQAPQVTLYEPNHLISTADLEYEYQGGAHGDFGVSCITFGQVGAVARVLTVGDFFLSGKDYHTFLNGALMAKLKAMAGADWAQDGTMTSVTNDQLNNFSVYPDGLVWHFDPYAAGSFASGEINVKMTWAELGPGLNKAFLP